MNQVYENEILQDELLEHNSEHSCYLMSKVNSFVSDLNNSSVDLITTDEFTIIKGVMQSATTRA